MSRRNSNNERKEIIGDRLRQVRKFKELTQPEFATVIGTFPGYISEIESGKKMAGTDIIFGLHTAFNVNINWLITGNGDMFEISEEEQSNECPVAVPLKKVKAPPLCYSDPVCKKISDICTTLNEPSKRAILKMMEGLQSESHFRKWSGEERRKKV